MSCNKISVISFHFSFKFEPLAAGLGLNSLSIQHKWALAERRGKYKGHSRFDLAAKRCVLGELGASLQAKRDTQPLKSLC
jgi:hypothetical protein